MFKNLAIVVCFLVSISATSQDLQDLSKDELNKLKKEAIEREDYGEAERIKKELDSRKSIDEFQTEYEEMLSDAVEKEDFEKAALIKDRLNLIDNARETDSLIHVAVKEERFGEAQDLKSKKERILRTLQAPLEKGSVLADDKKENIGEGTDEQNQADLSADTVKLKVVSHFFVVDLFVEDRYIGSVGRNGSLLLYRLPKGTYSVRFEIAKEQLLSSGPYTREFTFSGNTTVEIIRTLKKKKLDKLEEGTHAIDNGTKHVMIYSINKGLQTEFKDRFIYDQDYDNIEFTEREPTTTSLQTLYMHIDPLQFTSSAFNYGVVIRSPILRGMGLIYGWGSNLYVFNQGGSGIAASLVGSFGYRFQFPTGFVFRPDLEAGPSIFVLDGDASVGFGGQINLAVGYIFKKHRGLGIMVEPSIVFPGGFGFSIGLTLNEVIKYPEQRSVFFFE